MIIPTLAHPHGHIQSWRLLIVSFVCVFGCWSESIHASAAAEPVLELVGEVDGVVTADISTKSGDIVPLVSGQPPRAGARVNWRLRGDVMAAPSLARFSPIYFVRRLPPDGTTAPRGTLAVDLHWYVGPKSWPYSRLGNMGGIVVVAWQVDARPLKVVLVYVAAVQGSVGFPNYHQYETAGVSFQVPVELARGFPVLLLWQNGRWIKPRPYSEDEAFTQPMFAIYRGDMAALDLALDPLKDLNRIPGHASATLLHLAAECGQEPAVDLLLRRGARPGVFTDWDKASYKSRIPGTARETPLDWAVRAGHTHIVPKLLATKWGQSIPRSERNRLFRRALDGNWTDIAWNLLQADVANPPGREDLEDWIDAAVRMDDVGPLERAIADRGSQVFACARAATITRAAVRESDGCIQQLLRGGANPNASVEGRNVLSAAAEANRTLAMQAMLAAGAKVDQPAPDGGTALRAAVRKGHVEATRVLLEAGASPNATAPNDLAPLFEAVAQGSSGVVRLLLEHGADVSITAPGKASPLALALQRREKAMVEALTQHGARLTVGSPEFSAEVERCLAMDQLELIQRAADDGWAASERLHGSWPLHQVAELLGASRSAAWLEGRTSKPKSNAVFSPIDLDRQPRPLSVSLGQDARFFHAPYLNQGVEIEGVVDRDGNLRFAVVTQSPNPLLTDYVQSAMAGWRFQPALKSNKPVPVRARIHVTFAPDKKRKQAPQAATVTFSEVIVKESASGS